MSNYEASRLRQLAGHLRDVVVAGLRDINVDHAPDADAAVLLKLLIARAKKLSTEHTETWRTLSGALVELRVNFEPDAGLDHLAQELATEATALREELARLADRTAAARTRRDDERTATEVKLFAVSLLEDLTLGVRHRLADERARYEIDLAQQRERR